MITSAVEKPRRGKLPSAEMMEIVWQKDVPLANGIVMIGCRRADGSGKELITGHLPKGKRYDRAELEERLSESIGFAVRWLAVRWLVFINGKGSAVEVRFGRVEVRGQKRPEGWGELAEQVAKRGERSQRNGAPKASTPAELKQIAGQVERNGGGTAEDHPGEPGRGKVSSKKKAKLIASDPARGKSFCEIAAGQVAGAGESNDGGHAAPPRFERLPLDVIVVSPHNPRQHFDAAKLQELADSIKAKGVLQPILVRPIAGGYLAIANGIIWGVYLKQGGLPPTHVEDYHSPAQAQSRAAELNGPAHYELVAGERRWRAAKLAGLVDIPCSVQEMSDKEADEIRLIENGQRDDLGPLEEAAGYQRLITVHGYTVDGLAEKLHKSMGYLYGILNLDRLPEQAKAALVKGELTKTTAQLIARLPGFRGREQVTKFALEKAWNDRQPGFREVQEYIQQRFMIELKQAPFDGKDADLLPGAGACTSCPKRTGNNRDEYPDSRADICTDPECYRQKLAAHEQTVAAKAEAKGLKVLTGRPARQALRQAQGWGKQEYIDLASTRQDGKKSATYQSLVKGKLAEEEIVGAVDEQGRLHKLAPRARVQEVLGIDPNEGHTKHTQGLQDFAAQDRLRQACRGKFRERAFQAIEARLARVEGLSAAKVGDVLHQAVRVYLDDNEHNFDLDDLQELAQVAGIRQPGADIEALGNQFQALTGCSGLTLLLMYFVDPGYDFDFASKHYQAWCKLLGIDAKQVKKDAAAALKTAEKLASTPAG